jgi:hypothetical protein
LGPVLAASLLLPADADLIVDGVLYEIKVMLGRKNSAGVRYSVFELEDIRQTFCYALFDTTDEFCLNEMVLHSARYGQLYRMPPNETLAELWICLCSGAAADSRWIIQRKGGILICANQNRENNERYFKHDWGGHYTSLARQHR